MRVFSVLLTLTASFLFPGYLEAQTFHNPLRVATTQDPISLFTVDVNGDGVPDLVYETSGTSATPTTMMILFGQSSGGYVAGPTVTLPTDVGGCNPVDANRDGKIDLVCMHEIDEFDMEIATLPGNGDGTFQTAIYSAPMQSEVGINDFFPWMFTPAVLTSSGVPDLLIGDSLDEWIFVLIGDGTGRFTVKTVLGGYPTSGISQFTADAGMSITVTDLNGDGKPDLAFSNGPTILLGNGDGTFQTPATYEGGSLSSCVYHDMDGDGHVDAVCANIVNGTELSILHGNADGTFNATPISTQAFLTSDLAFPVAIQDVNGDGIPDILAYSTGGFEVLLGESGLKFGNPVHYAVGYSTGNGQDSFQLTDINQDGHVDLLAIGPNGIYISYGNADGTFKAPAGQEVAKVLGHATLGDFNGDGKLDIAATGDQSIELSLGNGDGTFKAYTALANGGIDFSAGGEAGDAQIVHGDFRGNGKQDIVAIGSPGTYEYDSYILFGNGDGTFASPQLIPNTSVVRPVFDVMGVLDINKDGRDDIETIDAGNIYSALSNGDGTFTTVSTAIPNNPSGITPSFPVFADFSHSGKLDAAYGLATSVQVLKGNGDGTFATTGVSLPVPSYMGQAPYSGSTAVVATGDFDGDGNADIAALVEIVPEVAPWNSRILTVAYVYYGNGDGTFSAPVLAGAFSREYTGIFAADLNKDGLADLILQTTGVVGFTDEASGDGLGVLLSKAGRTFGAEVNYTGGNVESGLFVADLNGDGYPDLLAINAGYFANGDYSSLPPNIVTPLLNLGAQTSSQVSTSTVVTSSRNPAEVGASITFTATVSSSTPGAGVPTGTVKFTDQAGIDSTVNLIASGSSSATATLTTSSIGIGTDTITAKYSGDTVFAVSTGQVSQTVTGIEVILGFTSVPNPVVAGSIVTLTATVANPLGDSAAAPTGTVTFSDGATTLAGPVPVTAGEASAYVNFYVVGLHTLTATYSGDALHEAATASLVEQVLGSAPSGGATGEWTWMGGSSTDHNNCDPHGDCGQPGVYGVLGVTAATNFPGGRSGSSTWTDSSGNFWLFDGQGIDGNGNPGLLNDLWKFNPDTIEWTWVSGSSTFDNNCMWIEYCGQSGVYGIQKVAAPGNIPGGRSVGVSWSDSQGHFWFFGGYGDDASGSLDYLNDLWEYDPSANEWTWVSGSKTGGMPGVYGTKGTAAASNTPGAREMAMAWTDSSGKLWLFGGLGNDANDVQGYLNDLWSFDPSTKLWTWVGGSSTIGKSCGFENNCGAPGVYGTLGAASASSYPGSRQSAISWTDKAGNIWLFGGLGFDSAGGWNALNDLWEFFPATGQWAWMGGSSTVGSNGAGQPNVYGTQGEPAAGNSPGGHYDSTAWVDGKGNFWFYGGWYVVTTGSETVDDQWEYNPSTKEWTWWGGGLGGQEGVYGTLGVPAPGDFPGGRSQGMAWTDSSGNPWLFGGGGYDENNDPGALNDLWTYLPGSSLPVAATPTFNPPAGNYSSAQTVTISDTTPGAVIYYTTNGSTPTASSPVYSAAIPVSATETIEAIAAASGYANSAVATANYTIASTTSGPGQWAWMGGSSTVPSTNGSQPGVYGTLGVAAPGNVPGGRDYAATWTDKNGNFWLYGGLNYYGNSEIQTFQDLWEYSPSTRLWAWMGGSTGFDQLGTYGTLGTPSAANSPGSRYGASTWTDPKGNLWLFGGLAANASDNDRSLNDLWEFLPSINQWVWMGGSNVFPTNGLPGNYGTLGAFAAGNTPGGRYGAASWTDSQGNLWLFGGYGNDAVSNYGFLDDIWEFSPSTNQWAWMGGSSTMSSDYTEPSVYGTLGTAAAGNTPGGRSEVSSWTDKSGNFWFFGGDGIGTQTWSVVFNDLWELNPSTLEWTWMGGSSASPSGNSYGTFGTLDVPAPGNLPPGLSDTSGWTDSNGNFWLFGGWGIEGGGTIIPFNSLWQLNSSIDEWAWMGGNNTAGASGFAGVYGVLGVPAAANIPGSRGGGASWTDSGGNFWLFGGVGPDASGTKGYLNDLWRYGATAPSEPLAATPTFNPPGGSYASPQTVAISDATPGAVIYYTTDGSTPTTGSSVYSTAIPVAATETIKAIAAASGYGNSAVGSATYTITASLIATTTTLTASATALTAGQTLTLTATVTAASGATPTGTVTFLNGTTTLGTGTLNASGVATLVLTPAIGAYSITASYAGSTTDAASTSSPAIAVTVTGIVTSTALAAVPEYLNSGQILQLTAEVHAASGAAPTGTINFLNGTTSLGIVNLGAGAIATLKRTVPAGNYSIVASYSGSATDDPSVSPPQLVFVSQFPGDSPNIYAFAGNGNQGFAGDGGLATDGELNTPYAVAVDAEGNAFVADRVNNRVRRVDASSGVITTIAGTGTGGYSGDGGLAINAELAGPSGVAVDAAGDVYISDNGNQRVRKVDAATGIITTYAGNTTGGAAGIGDGGPATSAHLLFPYGLALDDAGNLYIADTGHDLIREVSVATGVINTVAGDMNGAGGYGGDGGPATSAYILQPTGVAVDSAGNIYIADTDNDLIREVNASTGIITSVAGTGSTGYNGDGGPATQFAIWGPSDVVVDAAGNLYIADLENIRVRKVTAATGIITTYAGIGLPGNAGDGGPANFAYINRPQGLGIDKKGNLYIADTDNNCVRIVGQQPEYGIPTTTTLTASATSLVPGQSLTLTATVTAASGATPAGTVTFYNGTTSMGTGTLNANGVATLTLTPALGTYSITATYGGSSTDAASTSAPPITVTVALIATTTTLVATPTSLTVGQSLTLTATVAAASGATPTGTVTFMNGAMPLGTGTLNAGGVATLTLTPAAGAYSITASYGGSFTDAASVSAPPITVTVTLIATTTTLVAAPTSLTVGQTLTLTATVTAASGATPAGTVTFMNGATSLGTGTLNASGVATLAVTPAVGSYSITASYGGSTTDAASVSAPPITVNVAVAPTTTTLVAVPTTLPFGQSVTLTATTTAATGPMPTGTITFFSGATSLGTGALNTSGIASLTLNQPAAGVYSITASYPGSTTDGPSVSSPATTVTVTPAATATTVSSSLNPAPFGAAVTFSATVSSSGTNAPTPTGSVSFYDGTALLSTATLSGGMASYSTSGLSVGSHNITAAYVATANFSASTSSVLVQVINPATFTLAATPASQTLYTGQAAIYTATVTPGIGFNLPVALSCTQVPANTTCSFSPATVNSGGWTSTLTVQTTAPAPATNTTAASNKLGVAGLAGLLLLFVPRRMRRYRKGWQLLLLAFVSISACIAITACAGPGQISGGTPAGTQTITITGIATNGSQSLTQSTSVTLNVQSLF